MMPSIRRDFDGASHQGLDAFARVAVVGLFALAMLYTLSIARDIFLPIFLAVFLSFVFRPVVRRLNRIGVPTLLSALVILVFTLGVFALAVTMLREPAAEWLERAPQTLHKIEQRLAPLQQTIEQAREASEDLQRVAQGSHPPAEKVVVETTPLLQRVIGFTATTLVQAVATITLFLFLLAQGSVPLSASLARLLSLRHVAIIERAVEDVEARVSTYLAALALINLGVGVCTALAMLALGAPNPLLWGVVAALLGPMPYVGPMLTVIILLAMGATAYHNAWMVFAPAAAYLVINQIEAEFVTPLVQGRALKLSPVAVFLSIMLWTWMWGALGALLAVPILVVVTAVLEHVTKPNSGVLVDASDVSDAVRP